MATELIRTVVTGPVETPLGDKPLQGRIRLTLTGFDGQGGTVVTPVTLEATLDSEGQFSLQPWCPAEGDYTLSYDVEIGWWSEAANAFVWKHWGYIAPIYAAAPQPILALRTTTPPAPLPVDLLAAINAAVSASAASAALATGAAATATAAAASINSRAVDNTAALKALDTTVWRAAFIRAGANQGLYFWAAGDFTLQHTEEAGADLFFVKADAIAITAGCWVRFVIKPDKADWHYSRAMDGSIALEVRAQGEAVSWLGVQQGNNSGGGTTPYGPTIYTEGIYTSADLNVALKGTGKMFIGGDEGIILQLEPRGDGYVTDRVPILRPGAVGAGTYAQLLSAGGVEIGANGFPVFQVLGGAGDGTALLTLTPSSNSTLSLFTASGDSLSINAAGGLFLNGITSKSVTSTTFTVASGATVNLSPFNGLHNINPTTNPIATLTINFPAAPSNGQELRVSFSNTVTAITWASLGGHVIRGEEASGTQENPQNFVYITGIGWVRS